jgi:Zn-finger nucleic acid-binding protein
MWADADSFRKLCEDRETQTIFMGPGTAMSHPQVSDPSAGGILYRPCPACAELMNRFNFAGCSGVILDACKPHGVWFDADDLRRMVAFIRGGGLDAARQRELHQLEEARRRLEHPEPSLAPILRDPLMNPHPITSARGLLETLFNVINLDQ